MRALMQRRRISGLWPRRHQAPTRDCTFPLHGQGLIRMMGACSVGRTSWLGLNGATDGTLKWARIAAGLSDRSYRPHIS